MAEMEKKTVNAMGDVCPVPLVKAKNAIAELAGSGKVEVLVDNEIAVQNLEKNGAAERIWLSGKREERKKSIMWSSPYRKQSRLKQKRKPYASYRRQKKKKTRRSFCRPYGRRSRGAG